MSSSTKKRSPEPTRPFAPERRFDAFTGRWVVIAGNRADRPIDQPLEDETPRLASCPFCAGRESETTPTIASWPPATNLGDDRAWQVRIVSNLYPAFVPEPSVAETALEGVSVSTGLHDVIIESPRHLTRLTELTEAEASIVFRAYRQRMSEYAKNPQIAYGIVFKNCGAAAGMSREHIHGQAAGLPFVPPAVENKLRQSAEYHRQQGTCLFCATLSQELDTGVRVVRTTPRLIALCPFASRFPYETWILPRQHQAAFESSPEDLMEELSTLMLDILRRLESLLTRPAYNYIVQSSPFDTSWKDHYHWHIEVIPRLSRLAGLEWGTGVHINTVSPECAADRLRNLTSP